MEKTDHPHHHHSRRSSSSPSPSSAVGFALLPSELIETILLSLVLPELFRLKSLNKSVSRIISDRNFVRQFNSRSTSATWLFLYKKRWHKDAILQGFTRRSDRVWFKIEIGDLLRLVICPGESLYFLTASGNVFLFASNTRKEVIAVNLVAKTATKLPPSPLGPRGTSSWRRSGMKLVSSGSDAHFRFMFGELVDSRPFLFIYSSDSDTWQSLEALDGGDYDYDYDHPVNDDDRHVFLNISNGPEENMLIAVRLGRWWDQPVVLRPRYESNNRNGLVGHQAVGFSWGNMATDQVHVYGDGYTMVIRSKGGEGAGIRVLESMELWELDGGRKWRYTSGAPMMIMEEIKKKPYRAMMGCLALEGSREGGKINGVLLCNFEGIWDVVWVCFDLGKREWRLVQVADCKMKGLNLAGIAFSSGLTLSSNP
ncbi:hypothetical protein LINGRAHAP2_LOCUS20765 [Linum grandiflorum]